MPRHIEMTEKATYIRVQTPKALLLLTQDEYRQAITRGKAYKRAMARQERAENRQAAEQANKLAWIE